MFVLEAQDLRWNFASTIFTNSHQWMFSPGKCNHSTFNSIHVISYPSQVHKDHHVSIFRAAICSSVSYLDLIVPFFLPFSTPTPKDPSSTFFQLLFLSLFEGTNCYFIEFNISYIFPLPPPSLTYTVMSFPQANIGLSKAIKTIWQLLEFRS